MAFIIHTYTDLTGVVISYQHLSHN